VGGDLTASPPGISCCARPNASGFDHGVRPVLDARGVVHLFPAPVVRGRFEPVTVGRRCTVNLRSLLRRLTLADARPCRLGRLAPRRAFNPTPLSTQLRILLLARATVGVSGAAPWMLFGDRLHKHLDGEIGDRGTLTPSSRRAREVPSQRTPLPLRAQVGSALGSGRRGTGDTMKGLRKDRLVAPHGRPRRAVVARPGAGGGRGELRRPASGEIGQRPWRNKKERGSRASTCGDRTRGESKVGGRPND
jgi:hypothetical protein